MAKRGQGEGSISKRPDGTWWARITLGKDENGKQKRKAYYGKTRKEVQEKLTAAVNDINNDTYIDPSKMTVGQWMDTWMKQYKRNSIKASTYAIYSSSIRNQIEPSIGNYPLKEVRNDMLQKFINGLIEKDLSPSTIRDIFKPLKGAFGQAFDNGLISKNPTYKITLPPLKRAETKVLTVDEQQCFIERSKGYRNGNLYILMLLTGLRIGEALALTWDDIDFDNNLLSVNKTQTLYTFLPDGTLKTGQSASTPKTRSSIRKIPLIPSAVEALKVQKSEITNVLESYGNSNPQNLIFCTRSGKMLDTTFVRQQIKIITGKAGISGIHPHSLRHTFATRGLEQGIELKVMQELLGHSTIDMTANLYTHVLPDKKMDSMMKLQNTVNL